MRGKYLVKAISFLAILAAATVPAVAQDAPKVLGAYLKPNVGVKGEVVAVIPPDEIQEYLDIVKEASAKNAEWFAEYSAKSKPGIPLAYDERLGLSKEQYAKYLELWDQREFKMIQPVGIRLEPLGDQWMIRVSGVGAKITLLRYDPETDAFTSPNGKMKRLEDIKAEPESILRAWTGHEWKYEEESALGKTKENFAIGKTEEGKFGLLVYRLQDVSSVGRVLYDQSVLIRFPLEGGGE
ncbi:MAG: hypothetical protein ACSHYF_18200 [Verrucomicrobiaceae bacterium]